MSRVLNKKNLLELHRCGKIGKVNISKGKKLCPAWWAGKAQCQITFELEGSTPFSLLCSGSAKSQCLCYNGTKTKIGSTGHAHSLNNNVGVCVRDFAFRPPLAKSTSMHNPLCAMHFGFRNRVTWHQSTTLKQEIQGIFVEFIHLGKGQFSNQGPKFCWQITQNQEIQSFSHFLSELVGGQFLIMRPMLEEK